jgi:hypothetical protein
MPIVSVNLSAAAYEIWASMPKGRRSARVSYLILRNYNTGASSTGERVAPIVEEGDMRIMNDGRTYTWQTEGGWKAIGEKEPDPPQELEEKPSQKSAMEQWADIQKGIYE